MKDDLVLVEKDGAVGIVHLNRPDKLNALSPDMMEAMASAVEGLDADRDIRVIILAGSARVFAAGADIEAMSKWSADDVKKASSMECHPSWERIDFGWSTLQLATACPEDMGKSPWWQKTCSTKNSSFRTPIPRGR